MADALRVGDKIPSFLAKDHDGFKVTEEDVAGTPLVLYFYPKDASPEAVEIATAFRDALLQFDVVQALIVGVSPDAADTHRRFLKEKKLEFSLLADEKKDMCTSFGVLDRKGEVIPTLFVVDHRGEIKWVEKPLKPKGAADRALEAVKKHCKVDVARYDDFVQDYKDFIDANLKTDEDAKKIEEEILREFGIKKSDLKGKKKQ